MARASFSESVTGQAPSQSLHRRNAERIDPDDVRPRPFPGERRRQRRTEQEEALQVMQRARKPRRVIEVRVVRRSQRAGGSDYDQRRDQESAASRMRGGSRMSPSVAGHPPSTPTRRHRPPIQIDFQLSDRRGRHRRKQRRDANAQDPPMAMTAACGSHLLKVCQNRPATRYPMVAE